MRVKFSVGIGMVNAVHNAIGPGAEVRRTLCDPGKKEEKFFPPSTHVKGPVCRITVLEKCLGKKAEVPVQYKEKNNKNHG